MGITDMSLHMQGLWLIISLFYITLQGSLADTVRKWKNDQITAIRSANPTVGEPLIIAVRHREEFIRSDCYFYPPPHEDVDYGVWYYVSNGTVYDNTDQAVDGIEFWNDGGDASTCGIKILEMADFHDESDNLLYDGWRINLSFPKGGVLGQETLNQIEVEIHLKKEVMRTLLERRFGMRPLHYNVSLVPDLTNTSRKIHFQGNVKMDLVTTSYPGFIIPVQMAQLEIRDLSGTATRQNTSSTEDLEYHMIYFNLQEDLVILFASNSLFQPGDIVSPEIGFEVSANHDGFGLYKEKCDSDHDKWCFFTQFESVGARYAFPCHDEPGVKAAFDVKVARTEGWKTLGNMPIVKSEPVEGMEGWVWDIFETTPEMSSYTLALAIQDFEPVPAAGNMTIWATKSDVEAGYVDYASEVGPDCITFMEDLLDVKYSLPKMDMMSVPNFAAGAMENWGLILYEWDYLLYDQTKPDHENDRKYDVLDTIAHELAHQWFGNLVTMHWWDQLWLNEGFATYMSHVVSDGLDSNIHSWDRFVAESMFYVMKEDSTSSSWAISDPVVSNDDIDRKFGDITYSKGGALIRMIESFLGVTTLNKGLSSYLKDFSYMATVEEDLFMHLEAAGLDDGTWPQVGAEDLQETMKKWTQQAGLPLVTIRKITGNGQTSVQASQSWYKDGVIGSTDQLWSIPLTIVDLAKDGNDWDDTTPDTWLTDVSVDISMSDESIPLLNKKAVGYYRVNYSLDIWSDIANVLLNNHQDIHPFNRAQIICDVYSLEKNGFLDTDSRDLVLQYYEKEDDFAPVRAHRWCKRGFRTS